MSNCRHVVVCNAGKLSWSSEPRGRRLYNASFRLNVIQHVRRWEGPAIPRLWYLWRGSLAQRLCIWVIFIVIIIVNLGPHCFLDHSLLPHAEQLSSALTHRAFSWLSSRWLCSLSCSVVSAQNSKSVIHLLKIVLVSRWNQSRFHCTNGSCETACSL